MPLLMALGGLLLEICASMVGRALIALGMSYVTFRGMSTGIDWLMSQIQTNMGGMDSKVLQFLAYLWVDKAISMCFSAYAAAAVIKMAGSATMTKLITKGAR